jgi:hypothetical protein
MRRMRQTPWLASDSEAERTGNGTDSPAVSLAQFALRVFLTSTILLAALFAGAAAIIPALNWSVVHGFRIGTATGTALTIALVAVDCWQRRKVVKRYGIKPDYRARQTRTFTATASSSARALATIEARMVDLPWLYPQSLQREDRVLRAVTRLSMSSFSENLSVLVTDVGPNEVSISIVSAPRSIGTIVDYGKGIENVEDLKRAIETWLG